MSARQTAIAYNVKVDIHELHNCRFSEAGKDIVPNPFIDVEVCGKKKSTPARQQVSSTQFNSQFNFTVQLPPDDFLLSTIEITACHAYMFTSAPIGGIVLSFSHVYSRPQHWVYRQWVGIHNPDSPADNAVRLHENNNSIQLTTIIKSSLISLY